MFRRVWTFAVVLLATPVAAEPVRAVQNGDTLVLADGKVVRLHDVSAPAADETCPGADGRPWRCGAAALQKLRDLTAGQQVMCVERGAGPDGRMTALCYAMPALTRGGAKTDLSLAMVQAGLARAHDRYGSAYVRAEQQARGARLGIWAAR